MKNVENLQVTSGLFKSFLCSLFLLFVLFQFTACKHDEDRNSISGIYGAIVDKDGKGVENIEVQIYGKAGNEPRVLLQNAFTNKLGNYDVTVDVPGKFEIIEVSVPFTEIEGSKEKVFGKPIDDPSSANIGSGYARIGEKTRMDFKLVEKW
ncbi:hypothetical protein [Dyadobacter sediminis]|uniref:Carboxypeptidase regulatory-like domain-containing protein n=1 Tax=Dyadobacter sediminis TaxID=1493691 RepID=A0A5R9KIC8_9BACT|nr:hypothetical protein [Dyadobacter sediminis]TLU95968.1 hypothetical protein FEM55_02115 [Dyadobacter sediminis]GGB78151.1 hypothetical protein GCM10011325_02050 [Dyadobacter sediminis]